MAHHIRCFLCHYVLRRRLWPARIPVLFDCSFLSAIPRARRTANRKRPGGLGGTVFLWALFILLIHYLPQNFQLTKTNEEIYKSLSHGLRTASGRRSGDYRHLVGGQILKLEFAPYINRIISPPLRPVCASMIDVDPSDGWTPF
jgi:hypothetical protein